MVHTYRAYTWFKNVDNPVQIERQSCTFEVLKCIFYTRKQFPLMLAFAITIHKSQGLSLSTAIVDAGPSCLGSGMSYVALSRVTSVTGLHLIDFDKSKIVCNKRAVTEYNRLRSLYVPHLGVFCLKRKKKGPRPVMIPLTTKHTMKTMKQLDMTLTFRH